MLVWPVMNRLMVHTSCDPFTLTILTIHLLIESHTLAPVSAAGWFNKGSATCCGSDDAKIKDPQLSVIE